ncbi:MAG TPA: SAM-dependent DNA methyltransferase [Candidatus Syntrophoarchaeum butanivorans]|uniref:site-specific DNA-methyltransferase (adenine-specific) n=1 Tax=Candidatus Syntropharchaeum butanivorans TaxID=1839936 RepID=A0A1F2P429_9EURY|nr:MAG: type I restriction-modification system, M subunit [Candidatus Syntrophoarchaeum butanivorans]HEC57417.1 SAM-dependent DNA methyltransferase [Candidatus Syntrophoarchaeum butanivorans]
MVSRNARSNGDLNFMDELWEAANRLRGSMDAAEYKNVVLGLIFLKYVSDMFEFRRKWLENVVRDKTTEYYVENATDDYIKELVEDKDEYIQAGVFYIPSNARWDHLMANAMSPEIGKLIDSAMRGIEKENAEQLKGVLPKIYTGSRLSPVTLGELINLFSRVGFCQEDREKDILGRVYEYFIGQFAQAEGRKGGEFYTPRCVVKLLVDILEPYEGRVYDPACGSGGMFVQSWKFIEAHHKNPYAISIYGQEKNGTTWRICKMNLAIRGIPSENIALGDTLLDDKFPTLKADFIITNPPFNMTKWGANRVQKDARWEFGIPDDTSKNGGNYAWIQHYIYHLSPRGRAGFVMANGSLSCGGKYGEIRKRIIENDLVDCIVALPPKLFLTTQIPACLWFLARNKDESGIGYRDRRRDILFIDAREMFDKVSRNLNELSDEHIRKIADTYRAWRGIAEAGEYEDVPGFCKAVTLEEIRKHNYILTPGSYVGIAEEEEDDEPFEQKMVRLTKQLAEQFARADELKERIRKNLGELGYGF